MKNKSDKGKPKLKLHEVEEMEKLIAQLDGLHDEILMLARKTPNGAVSKFKISLINEILDRCNNALNTFKPLGGFTLFDIDEIPTNSDISVVLSQYINTFEVLRASNIELKSGYWYYIIADSDKAIRTCAPKKIFRPKG